jgi:hypothetical protein
MSRVISNGSTSDAAYFDLIARQSANACDREELRRIADAFRRAAVNSSMRQLSRGKSWQRRADQCRAFSRGCLNEVCRKKLERLASTYELLAELSEPRLLADAGK